MSATVTFASVVVESIPQLVSTVHRMLRLMVLLVGIVPETAKDARWIMKVGWHPKLGTVVTRGKMHI